MTVSDRVISSSCRIDITGMDCGDCAKTIEASLRSMPGVQTADVNFARGSAELAFAPETVDRAQIEGRIRSLGYGVAQAPASATWIFDIRGMDCGDCAKTVEQGVRRLPGIASAEVNFAAATMSVTASDSRLSPAVVVAAVSQAGFEARPHASTDTRTPTWWQGRRVIETAIASLLWLAGFALEHAGAPRVASAIPMLLAMAVAGYPVARAALYALRARRADMNVLMTIAAVGAVAIGEWDEGSSVLILFAIGLTLQNLSLDRTRRAIRSLMALAPEEATLLEHGRERVVPVAEVQIGDTVLVRPGDRVPVDGIVLTGHSAVDQSPITGESSPVEIAPDAEIFAGSINGDGALEVRSTKIAGETALARIVQLVEEAQASRAPAQAFVDRFAAIYTPVVMVGALLLATLVPLVVGDFRDWAFKALVLLVVACPCALVISTPVALVAAIGSASRRGVLFKGGAAIESLARVRATAFDKTGTLTEGRPAVSAVISLGGFSETDLLKRAAAIEARSTHPLARGIVRAAQDRGIVIPTASAIVNLPGRGMQAEIEGETLLAGSRRLFPELPAEIEARLAALETEGRTTVLIGAGDRIDGIIALADPVRPASAGAIRDLTSLGLRTVMLTGDNAATAARVANEVGVNEIRAQLLPDEKVTALKELQREGPAAMIGDGINDAPALATAEVGIAMGAGGTDVAIESAQVVLVGDDLAHVPVAIRLARRTMATIRENIAAAILVKALFLGLTFLGVTNLWLAVLADMGMSLLVTFNSLRLIGTGVAKSPRLAGHEGHAHALSPSAAD